MEKRGRFLLLLVAFFCAAFFFRSAYALVEIHDNSVLCLWHVDGSSPSVAVGSGTNCGLPGDWSNGTSTGILANLNESTAAGSHSLTAAGINLGALGWTTWTLGAWIKGTDAADDMIDLEGGNIAMNLTSDHLNCFVHGASAGNEMDQGTTNVADGNPHFLACVGNGSTITAYVDGRAEGTPAPFSEALVSDNTVVGLKRYFVNVSVRP